MIHSECELRKSLQALGCITTMTVRPLVRAHLRSGAAWRPAGGCSQQARGSVPPMRRVLALAAPIGFGDPRSGTAGPCARAMA